VVDALSVGSFWFFKASSTTSRMWAETAKVLEKAGPTEARTLNSANLWLQAGQVGYNAEVTCRLIFNHRQQILESGWSRKVLENIGEPSQSTELGEILITRTPTRSMTKSYVVDSRLLPRVTSGLRLYKSRQQQPSDIIPVL